jgi:RNA polymerase sigma factor (sigma-70 family)
MHGTNDEAELFADFAATRSEEAFAGIIRIHANLVFSTALRQLGDRGLAEEVAQEVFVTLAKKAASLRPDRTMAGWLYQTTVNQARQRLRTELRRQNREQIAAAIACASGEGDSIWAMLIPLLDEALLSLTDKDRLAVVLHFMEQRPFRELGAILGVGEDAARKRVNRAVAELILWFQKRGVRVPGSVMVGVLSLECINGVSISAASVLASAVSSATISITVGGSTIPLIALMTSAQIKITAGLLALAAVLTTSVVLRGRNEATRHQALSSTAPEITNPVGRAGPQVKVRPPGPPATAQSATAVLPEKSFLERLNAGDMSLSMLSHTQADEFVALNKTNAQSLLAAFRVTHDNEYLRQAATNYPTDPAVLLRAVVHDAFPENRREWLDQLKRTDPDNALTHYLSASGYWNDNDIPAALKDLAHGAQKLEFKDYLTDHMQSLEEIYLSAGHSAAEAKALATFAVELPHISQLSKMSEGIADQMRQFREAGEQASVAALAQIGLALASHTSGMQDGGNLLGQMVGVKIEERVLSQLDPNQTYPFMSTSSGERLAALHSREQAIRADSQFIGQWIPQAPEQEQVSYFDRLKLYGESAAIQWLRNRSTTP